jgi:hypothetical protein
MSFSVPPGTSLEQMQQAMGRPAPLPLQQEIEHRPVAKKLRPKGDKPET